MYRLVFDNGPYKGKRLTVQQGTVLIGRDPDCHIHLADEEVSWQHAVVEDHDDGIYIRDRGSLNKIEINGEEVREAKLNHGDKIALGRTKITFQCLQADIVQEDRRVNHVQGITFAAVALIVLLEVILLVTLSSWRVDRGGGLVAPEEIAPVVAEEASVEEPAETEPVGVSVEEPVEQEVPVQEVVEAPEVAEEAPLPDEVVPLPDWMEVAESDKDDATIASADETEPTEPLVEPAVEDAEEPVDEAQSIEDVRAARPSFEVTDAAAAEDPLLELAQEMYEEALLEAQKHNLLQADQQLERLQIVAPDFYPAYADRALLYEQQAMLKEAGEQWAELLERCGGTPWYAYAAEQRARVASKEGVRKRIKPPQGVQKEAKRPPKLAKKITVDSVQRQKFGSGNEFDEMRLLTITLRARSGGKRFNAEDVKVAVEFYDQEEDTETVRLTDAYVPEEQLGFEGEWKLGDRRMISAAYIVPKGFRQRETSEQGRARSYYGYIIRVYYGGKLQDQISRPKELIEAFL